jgi:putative ATPase
MYKPLAEMLRPSSLEDIIGQSHLVGEGKPLSLLSCGSPRSIILWGPPGVGKTTIANILTKSWDCESIHLSAIFSGIKDIKEALDAADKNRKSMFQKQTVIFVDEIHRLNKAQQDAFLHHLENGSVILIGATTENPSFEINSALLSRSHVYILNAMNYDEQQILLDRAIATNSDTIKLDTDVRDLIIELADGDARRLINIVETIISSKFDTVNVSALKQIMPNILRRFDKGGEEFYNQISALHKSVRGSDPDAALYWFMRMLDGGADPLYIGRRILRIAWEDIGLADTNAQTVALNALSTYERLGSPEGDLALASAIIYLSVTPKSNSTEMAYNNVYDFVKKDTSRDVPLHLRNSVTELMNDIGYGKEYRYAHDYAEHYVPNENYWPSGMGKRQFYMPSNQGLEKRVIERLNFLRKLDKDNE